MRSRNPPARGPPPQPSSFFLLNCDFRTIYTQSRNGLHRNVADAPAIADPGGNGPSPRNQQPGSAKRGVSIFRREFDLFGTRPAMPLVRDQASAARRVRFLGHEPGACEGPAQIRLGPLLIASSPRGLNPGATRVPQYLATTGALPLPNPPNRQFTPTTTLSTF